MTDMSNCTTCLGTGYTEDFYPCDCGAQGITPERGQRNGMREDAPVRHAGNGVGRGARPVRFATAKQVSYLRSLIAGRDAANPAVIAAAAVCSDEMSMRDASTWIDALRAIRPAAIAGAVRPNNYPGKCATCGQHVAEQAGRIAPRASGKGWDTFHLDGACPTVAAPVAPVDGLDLAPLAKFTTRGMVRVAVPGGETRLKLMLKFAADGRTWVTDAAVYGERTTYGCQRPGQAYSGKCEDALRAVLADPMAALRAYAALTSECGMCGRPLEDEDSVARGIGPICAGKL
jgi:hypothetical protein